MAFLNTQFCSFIYKIPITFMCVYVCVFAQPTYQDQDETQGQLF